MAPSSRHPALRIDIPTLEPGDVMLERLVAASAGSVPSPGTPWLVGLRTAFVAIVVALLGATSWAAGALAGADTPFGHREIHHPAMVPTGPIGSTSPTMTAGSPQSGDSTSGSPAPTGLPDAASHSAKSRAARGASAAHRHGRHHSADHAHRATGNGPGPITAGMWPGLGIGHHYGWGKSRGRHHGGGQASHRNH